MSAQELIALTVDEDGSIDFDAAIEAIEAAINNTIEQYGAPSGALALRHLSGRITTVINVFGEQLISMQAAIVNLQQGMQLLLTGQQSTIPDYEAQEELAALMFGFELDGLAELYDMLLAEKGAASGDDQTEAGDDQREDDSAPQGGAREVPAETLAEGEDADSQE